MTEVLKHLTPKPKDYPEEDYGQCPYCFVGSWSDDYDDYQKCILTDDFQGQMNDCKEGQDACIVDYLHYTDIVNNENTIQYCEVGRDCCK